MTITHNLLAANSNRHLNTVVGKIQNSTEKLASGYRINRASDDAAGLSISEKMRAQIRGLDQASQNAQDGISLIQVADGALGSMHELLQRGRELTVQAANDTNTESERQAIQEEIESIVKEINNISKNTEFNTKKLFDSDNMSAKFALKASNASATKHSQNTDVVTFEKQDFSAAIKAAGGKFTQEGLEGFADQLKTNYVPKLLSGIQDALSTSAKPTTDNLGIGLKMYYTDNDTLAYVASNGTGYTLAVNMKYLSESNGAINMTDDLASTIAHEMTHAIMDDIVTNGMMGTGGANQFPDWFIEGTAQAVGGGRYYVDDLIRIANSNASDASKNSSIKEWLSGLTKGGYESYTKGYVATMYLGYVAGGSAAVDSATIAKGIDSLLKDVSDGYSLSQAISRKTNGKYESLTDFQKKFSTDAVDFAKKLATAVGGDGVGSIIAPGGLGGSQASLLTLSNNKANDFFTLDVDKEWVDNSAIIAAAGKNPYTGGGATTTNGSKRDGTTNADAETKWIDANTGQAKQADGFVQLQIGASDGQSIKLQTFLISDTDLGIDNVDVTNHKNAGLAITNFDHAIKTISQVRSFYGALQNRLEHTISNLDNTKENLQSAESRIRDVDIAKEMVKYSTNNILQQSAQSMLAQANQSSQGVLQLLR